MYSRKVKDPEWSLAEIHSGQDSLVKTSYPEPPEAIYYWEKKK